MRTNNHFAASSHIQLIVGCHNGLQMGALAALLPPDTFETGTEAGDPDCWRDALQRQEEDWVWREHLNI